MRTGNSLDLSNTVCISQLDTDLRRRSTLLGELADLVDDGVRGGFQLGIMSVPQSLW